MSDEKKCKKLEVIDELIAQLEMWEIPPDYNPGNIHYNEMLAEIRHKYTNYEELLWELPECEHCLEPQCIYAEIAHDRLKWAAKGIAQQAYDKWCNEKKVGRNK